MALKMEKNSCCLHAILLNSLYLINLRLYQTQRVLKPCMYVCMYVYIITIKLLFYIILIITIIIIFLIIRILIDIFLLLLL